MTRTDGTFDLDAAPGSYGVLFQMAGYHTRVLQRVLPGKPLTNVLLSVSFPCEEMATSDQQVRVIDPGDHPVSLSRVSSSCDHCWTSADGYCTVRIPHGYPNLPEVASVSHVDFEPTLIRSNSNITVRLANRPTTVSAPSAVPTVRVVTSSQAWTMEMSGPDRLLMRFLNDVDGHRFDDWTPGVTEDGTSMHFGFREDDWTFRVDAQDVRLTFGGTEGNLGVLRGRVIGKALESKFEQMPRLAVLAIFRIP
jgi:hypothetical protein